MISALYTFAKSMTTSNELVMSTSQNILTKVENERFPKFKRLQAVSDQDSKR